VLVLARHRGADHLGVSIIAGYDIEAAVAKQLGTQLSVIPKDKLPKLVERLHALPPMPTFEDALRTDQQILLMTLDRGSRSYPATTQRRLLTQPRPPAERYAPDDPRVLAAKAEIESAIPELLRIDQLPPEQWPEAQQQFMSKPSSVPGRRGAGNIMAGMFGAQRRIAQGRIQFRLLEAAVAVTQDGPDAVKRLTDPYGHPITAAVHEDGAIELSSDTQLGKPIILRLEPPPKAPAIGPGTNSK
jgi:hypothetical protein